MNSTTTKDFLPKPGEGNGTNIHSVLLTFQRRVSDSGRSNPVEGRQQGRLQSADITLPGAEGRGQSRDGWEIHVEDAHEGW